MKDAYTAALLGALIGYLAHAHWPELARLVQMLIV
jgi:hypothetical protein